MVYFNQILHTFMHFKIIEIQVCKMVIRLEKCRSASEHFFHKSQETLSQNPPKQWLCMTENLQVF